MGFKPCFSFLSYDRPSKHRLFPYTALSMGLSNSFPLHWPLPATHQAILPPCAKSSSKESLTGALRPAQSGTTWHLSDIAFVTYAGKCLPTRHLCLSWAPVP